MSRKGYFKGSGEFRTSLLLCERLFHVTRKKRLKVIRESKLPKRKNLIWKKEFVKRTKKKRKETGHYHVNYFFPFLRLLLFLFVSTLYNCIIQCKFGYTVFTQGKKLIQCFWSLYALRNSFFEILVHSKSVYLRNLFTFGEQTIIKVKSKYPEC